MIARVSTCVALAAGVAGWLIAGCRKTPPPPPASRPASAPAEETAPVGPRRVPVHLMDLTAAIVSTWDEAVADLPRRHTRTVAKMSKDPRVWTTIADLSLAVGDDDGAAELFYRAVALDQTRVDSLKGLAVALVAAGRYEEAAPVYRRILQQSPDDRTARFDLAVALSRMERFAEAEKLYRALLADNEDDLQALYNLAVLLQAQGKLSAARECWKSLLARAERIAPADAAAAWTSYGEVLTDLNEPAEAMEAYAQAAKLLPRDPACWYNLAVSARTAGSYGRAVMAAKNALEFAPESPSAWALLGDLLFELHQATNRRQFLLEAVKAWRESYSLDPTQERIGGLIETHDPARTPRATTRPS